MPHYRLYEPVFSLLTVALIGLVAVGLIAIVVAISPIGTVQTLLGLVVAGLGLQAYNGRDSA